MTEGALALQAAGAQAIAIACNTAHHWAEQLGARLSVPLLHIADAVAEAIAARPVPPRRVALLGTRGTLASGFYAKRLEAARLEWIAPTGEEQGAFVDPAIAAVKAGDAARARDLFAQLAYRLRVRGADLLILGCTELPLAAARSGFESMCLDANHALAGAIVRFARGEPVRTASRTH
jgi:aspartate racemase